MEYLIKIVFIKYCIEILLTYTFANYIHCDVFLKIRVKNKNVHISIEIVLNENDANSSNHSMNKNNPLSFFPSLQFKFSEMDLARFVLIVSLSYLNKRKSQSKSIVCFFCSRLIGARLFKIHSNWCKQRNDYCYL